MSKKPSVKGKLFSSTYNTWQSYQLKVSHTTTLGTLVRDKTLTGFTMQPVHQQPIPHSDGRVTH